MKIVTTLYMPSLCGRVGKRGKQSDADVLYDDFLHRDQNNKTPPPDLGETMTYSDKTGRNTSETNKDTEGLPTKGRLLHASEEAKPQRHEGPVQARQVDHDTHRGQPFI